MKLSIIQKIKSKLSKSKSNYSLQYEELLWYQENLTREEAEMQLFNEEIGVFLVRKSESIQDCYVLSVKVPKYINTIQVSHYLILKNKTKYHMKGFGHKEFNDLNSLITHCSYMRDMLPVKLNLEFYQICSTKSIYNYKSASLDSISSTQSDFSDLSEINLKPSSSKNNIFDDDLF